MRANEKDSFAFLITLTVLLAGVSVAVALSIYFLTFHGGVSNDQAVWGQFGDFVGGTVNPVLGFLTIIALALTLILQNRQLSISSNELALSREELQLTRQELSRSAKAQELSEQALRAQAATAERSARLTATNFLLDQYSRELIGMQGRAYTSGDPQLVRVEELTQRQKVLRRMIDSLFEEIAGGEK
jgi:hypothetical protein